MSERRRGSLLSYTRPSARAGIKDEAGSWLTMTKLGLVDVTFWPVHLALPLGFISFLSVLYHNLMCLERTI